MSGVYIRRLRAVQSEFDTARETLGYVREHWQRQNIGEALRRITPRDVARTELHVEATYLIRLYAEFEGILKDHLATNHLQVKVPDKPKVDWLINKVMQTENISLETPLRANLDKVRDYRNAIAHRGRRSVSLVIFGNALSWLNTFLAKLPEPLF